jgi:hypothetical protein
LCVFLRVRLQAVLAVPGVRSMKIREEAR